MPAPAPASFREPAPAEVSEPQPAAEPVPEPEAEATLVPVPPVIEPPSASGEIKVSRTLVKSQPELEQLIADDPRFAMDGMAVSMASRGFGTMVTISAKPAAGISEDQLAAALAHLSEPQRRPFTNT